ncbi:MAG: T9SS type A sorting domain-containing protein [Sphingobacteriales bacterium]|nr:MAG: T9SS type A sorting domain-containing protein [Sphingobacteriales bacterium]
MKNFTTLVLTLVFCIYSFAQTIDIGDARGVAPCSSADGSECFSEADCSTVTVQGIVTNGGELGPIRYIQDGTGGIGVYNPSVANNLLPGNLVTITGQVQEYNCLLEIVDDSSFSYTIDGTATIPSPVDLSAAAAFSETYEGQLVRVDAVQFPSAGLTFNGNTNYNIQDASGNTYQIRINSNSTSIVGTLIPSGFLNIIGIMSQFQGSYQLLPRSFSDFEFVGNAPVFTSSIEQTNLATDSFTLTFETLNEGNTIVHYGLTSDLELGTVIDEIFTTDHSIELAGLEPGNIYYVQIESTSPGGETSYSAIIPMATVSLSSGDIKVYFNRPVDTSVSTGENAIYLNQMVPDTLIAYLDRAKYTIDLCAYTMDNENGIVDAILAAQDRGVQIRIVADADLNATIYSQLPGTKIKRPSSLPGIMHNKFIVIDAFSENPNEPVVWTGSTNFTNNQLIVDPNNVIIFQDQSLAKGFTLEFEEMLGGSFSTDKTENTPVKYLIGGIPVESYFSPSSPMNSILINTVNSSDHDLYFGILSFTRNDLAQAIRDKAYDGVFVAGIIESIGSAEAQQVSLTLNSAISNTLFIDNTSAIFHHKYFIVDPNLTTSDPVVLTGSHNWSNSAAFRNDENTVVVHDATIANFYYQEFVKRYIELGGTLLVDSIVFVQNLNLPLESLKLYPNPVTNALNVQFNSNQPQFKTQITLLNSIGQPILNRFFDSTSGSITSVDVSQLPSGLYFLQVGNTVQKFQIIH